MASTNLTRTFTTPTNNKIWTLSFWIKRSKLSSAQFLFNTDGGNEEDRLSFNSGDGLVWFEQNSSAGTDADLTTNQVFRDTSGWYHIVLNRDSTQATASNRLKLYVNGSQVTSFATATYPSLNDNSRWNSAVLHEIGARNSTGYFDGSMSHIHFIDGTAYDASYFGETDANGVWKAKGGANVTYGTNGFFILKDSGSGTDQSGNGNNFTVGGTLTDTLDCPANVFATFNPLIYNPAQANYNPLFSNGNTTVASNTSVNAFSNARATLAMLSGKYYAEFKTTSSDTNMSIGLINYQSGFRSTNNWALNYQNDGAVSFEATGSIYINNSLSGTSFSGFTTGDIMQVAFDRTSEKVWLGKNGTWFNSGNPSNGTNELLNLSATIGNDEFWTFAVGMYHSVNEVWNANFGNGYFGTTAVASAGTNASGNGIFEYDVPTGYTALCTKGLNGE